MKLDPHLWEFGHDGRLVAEDLLDLPSVTGEPLGTARRETMLGPIRWAASSEVTSPLFMYLLADHNKEWVW